MHESLFPNDLLDNRIILFAFETYVHLVKSSREQYDIKILYFKSSLIGKFVCCGESYSLIVPINVSSLLTKCEGEFSFPRQ